MVVCLSGLGKGDQSLVTALTLLMWSFLVFVVQGGALTSTLGFGIFPVVSCLWIVTSWSSYEGD